MIYIGETKIAKFSSLQFVYIKNPKITLKHPSQRFLSKHSPTIHSNSNRKSSTTLVALENSINISFASTLSVIPKLETFKHMHRVGKVSWM